MQVRVVFVELLHAAERSSARSSGGLAEIQMVPTVRNPRARKFSINRRADLMTQRPDVCGNCRDLVGSELRSTHGRHRAAIFLGVRHSFSDRFQDSGVAAVAP